MTDRRGLLGFCAVMALSVLLLLAGAPSAHAQELGRVTFAFDSAALDAEARGEIARIAGMLRARDGLASAVVVGHTDAVGSTGYNEALGLRRARAVADALAQAGVPVARIGTVESRGERELLVAVTGPERANRRVSIGLADMLAACRTWRTVPLVAVDAGVDDGLRLRLRQAVDARARLAAEGRNGPAFQMAGAALEDCRAAAGYTRRDGRGLEYAKRCLCSSARLEVALR